ncbi:MAG: hypothetical protein IT229_06150 [Flavobacteriales bacterium]|nr:hypothetical protein [Flavobacteriales bacterium]
MFELITWPLHLLYKYLKNKRMDAHDKKVRMGLRQRSLHHSDIPPMEQVKVLLGERYNELHQLFLTYDPLELHTRRSRSGKDYKYADLVSRRYAYLTSTYGYRIRNVSDQTMLTRLLRVELGLWFGSGTYAFLNEQGPEALMPSIIRWRQRWDYR